MRGPTIESYLVGAAWLACHELACRATARMFGSEPVGGSPRWRSAAGFATSLVALPLLLIVSLSLAGSFEHWSHRCAVQGLGPYDWACVFIFGGLMSVDLLQGTMLNALLIAHHVTCLAGHTYATLYNPAAFPYYVAAVVALELGSAGSGAHALWPRSFSAASLLAVMTLSNAAAAVG
eukprot:3645575-Prymnesium_polylepis.1